MTATATMPSVRSQIEECLTDSARKAGWHQQADGEWTDPARGSEDAQWSLQLPPDGWLRLERSWNSQSLTDAAIVAQHSEWCGPVKLERHEGRVVQCLSLWLGEFVVAGRCANLDQSDLDMLGELLTGLFRRVPDYFRGVPCLEDWTPPPAEFLSDCLTDVGHTAAIDRNGNMRLTIKRPGCDGQLRIERSTGRLRCVLPLGTWSRLDPLCHAAMQRVASQANDNTRLARVSRLPAGKPETVCYEAQADLTGVPIGDPADAIQTRFWRTLVGTAMDGLALCLRRLGIELPLLAQNDSADLARIVLGEDDSEEAA